MAIRPLFPGQIGIWCVGFCGEEENQSRDENQQQTAFLIKKSAYRPLPVSWDSSSSSSSKFDLNCAVIARRMPSA